MNQEFPDTVAMWASTRADGLSNEEIFTPNVKVLLSWADVEAAVDVGAVVPSEAYALWAYWAAPGSPARKAAQVVLQRQELAAAIAAADAELAAESIQAPSLPVAPHTPVQAGNNNHSHSANHGHNHAGSKAHPQPPVGVPLWLRVMLLVGFPTVLVWAIGQGLGYW
jgi:hypothetical protein